MEEWYNTPIQIASYARQVDGIKIYLGPIQHDAFSGTETDDQQLYCGRWTSDEVNDVILPGNALSGAEEENYIEEDSEIYGIKFDCDGNPLKRNRIETEQPDKLCFTKPKRLDDVSNTNSSDGESNMSEALTVTIGCNDSAQITCKEINPQSLTNHELLESDTGTRNNVDVNSECDFVLRQPSRHNEHALIPKAPSTCHNSGPLNENKSKSNNRRRTIDNNEPDANLWHSRRTSLDVIKRKMQVKRNRAADAINAQYNQVVASHDVYSECSNALKRPKLKFMSAPGMKDKRKKQLTLMNMFKK